ncbi:uncharacterized protein LOC116200691 [Punica granatum]|uniref:Uncharacterized protein n=2 Tax=Punica granatum TaxID=22663 RepID=A0A218XX95_PUNGR|nr:uncharacterized protein LOC116200691 [Punica granatum]OWM89677.1 hypothetical protein CDL15_Pgr024425 [Punica granatum]PKI42634.1 hypothetical protein CRG98_036916 [Punica granatum]
MLKRCGLLSGLIRVSSRGSTINPRRELSVAGSFSLDVSLQFTDSSLSSQLKDVSVRIIHAGGREELYQYSVSAAQLMEKYPGMCVARPEVFKNPYESILGENDKLLVGHKYYIIPSTTVKKLKRRYQARRREKEDAKDIKQGGRKGRLPEGDGIDDFSEESVCSAKDFYVSKEKWSKCSLKKKKMRKKPFVPPIQKARTVRSLAWEPSLTSVQEISP